MSNNSSLLEKITSKKVLKTFFQYIKEPNFELKLFQHSKKHQNLLNIDIVDYEKAYLQKL